MSLHARYIALVGAVMDKGERFRKAHGDWYRLRLDDDPEGPFLQLDSWNRCIDLKRGRGDYDYFGGFEPYRRSLEHLGIDFGGYRLYITPWRLATYERLVAAR